MTQESFGVVFDALKLFTIQTVVPVLVMAALIVFVADRWTDQ